ncbi:MAG: exo-alpha-sialidase [Kofleriaceae bacterium]|nr:exo-alpha-sialidase [Kofleriaceae bacterium]
MMCLAAACGGDDGGGGSGGADADPAGGDDAAPRFTRLDLGAAEGVWDVSGAGPNIFLRAGSQILRSMDAGQSWITSTVPGTTRLSRVAAASRATIAWEAGMTAYFYRGGGDRWLSTGPVPGGAGEGYSPTNLAEAADGRLYLSVKTEEAFRPTRSHILISSGDNGATWRQDSGWDDGEPVGLHVLPDGGVRLLSSSGAVGVPGPTSVAWGRPLINQLNGLRMVGVGQTLWVLGERFIADGRYRLSLFRSDDGGQTWRDLWEREVQSQFLLVSENFELWARDADTVVFLVDSMGEGLSLVEVTGETAVTTLLSTTPLAGSTSAAVGGNADALILVNGTEAWVARD